MKLEPETRDTLVVISFFLLVGTFIQVTASPSFGTVKQEALLEVRGGEYGEIEFFEKNPIPEDQIACIGDYELQQVYIRGEPDLVDVISVDKGKCVYPGTVKKHYIELYGFKVIL